MVSGGSHRGVVANQTSCKGGSSVRQIKRGMQSILPVGSPGHAFGRLLLFEEIEPALESKIAHPPRCGPFTKYLTFGGMFNPSLAYESNPFHTPLGFVSTPCPIPPSRHQTPPPTTPDCHASHGRESNRHQKHRCQKPWNSCGERVSLVRTGGYVQHQPREVGGSRGDKLSAGARVQPGAVYLVRGGAVANGTKVVRKL